MSRGTKIALGAVTLIPPLWMVVWFGYFIYGFTSSGPWPAFTAMFIAMAVVVVLGIGLTIFYVIQAATNDALRNDERVMWILLVTLLGTFAHPVYWYMHIWRRPLPS